MVDHLGMGGVVAVVAGIKHHGERPGVVALDVVVVRAAVLGTVL